LKQRLRGVSIELQQQAGVYRKQPTEAEAVLWASLRCQQLEGLRFRQQHPLAGFILDFYCPAYRLVIELDGPIHDRQRECDEARTHILKSHGCRVLRFSNAQVLQELASVHQAILAEIVTVPRRFNPPLRPTSGELKPNLPLCPTSGERSPKTAKDFYLQPEPHS